MELRLELHAMKKSHFSFWSQWLVFGSGLFCLFGLFLVMAPGLSLKLFSCILYFSPDRISTFPPEAVAYIRLAHAIIGAMMVGWGLLLGYLFLPWARGTARSLRLFCVPLALPTRRPAQVQTPRLYPFRRRELIARRMAVFSIGAWFILDTAFSIFSGFWPNVLLNAFLALIFAIPLAFTRRAFCTRADESLEDS